MAAGQESRDRFEPADFMRVAPMLAPADLVMLDRVLRCYPGLEPFVRRPLVRSASLAAG